MMILDLLLFVIGLVILYFGAEFLVGGASSIALRIGITPLIVGCTVVAFGTSAPELVVSLVAVIGQSDDISVGNVIGSNIANLALILGAAAMIRPMQVTSVVVKREYPVMLAASLLLIVLALDGRLSVLDGFVLLAAMSLYIGYMIVVARRDMAAGKTPEIAPDLDEIDVDQTSTTVNVLKIVGGIIGLAGGAHLMVTSAVSIARVFEVPELLIGISIVAIGTSLPELATSVVAAVRGESDISVGNVIGSNVFNLLLVLGAVGALMGVDVGADALSYDLWIMLGISLVIWPIMWSGGKIGRLEGTVMLLGYVSYMVWLFMR